MMKKAVEKPYNTRTSLIGLWIVLILLYLYCDIFSFFRTGTIAEMLEGKIGLFDVTQTSLLMTSLIMMLPILMILVNLSLKFKITKLLNIIAGLLFTFVNIGNLVGEIWAYYWAYGIIELFITIYIVVTALNWKENDDIRK